MKLYLHVTWRWHFESKECLSKVCLPMWSALFAILLLLFLFSLWLTPEVKKKLNEILISSFCGWKCLISSGEPCTCACVGQWLTVTLLRLMILTHYSVFTCLTTCWHGGSKWFCLLVSIIQWKLNLVFLCIGIPYLINSSLLVPSECIISLI
jgi:hypothetical protein